MHKSAVHLHFTANDSCIQLQPSCGTLPSHCLTIYITHRKWIYSAISVAHGLSFVEVLRQTHVRHLFHPPQQRKSTSTICLYAEYMDEQWTVPAANACGCAVDLAITCSLTYLLYRNRSGIAKYTRLCIRTIYLAHWP